MTTAEQWSAEHSRRFRERPMDVRTHVRYEVIRHNLLRTLGDFLQTPKHIADVGGADGKEILELFAELPGQRIVLVESDAVSVVRAIDRSKTRFEKIIHGDSQNALDEYGPGEFDLVLSHGVLQYLPDPKAELRRLAQLLRPDGYLSLVTAGKFGKINRAKREGDQANLDSLLDTGLYLNNIDARAKAYVPHEIDEMLTQIGFDTEAWFGVRIDHDDNDKPIADVPVLHLNRVVRSEIELSRDPLRRSEGQMLHYIAHKNT